MQTKYQHSFNCYSTSWVCLLGCRYKYFFILNHLTVNSRFLLSPNWIQREKIMGCWLVMQNQHSRQRLGQTALFTHVCCTYCKSRFRVWNITTFLKKQIISPQNQNGRITVSNSHTNLFWNSFSAAKINMPFRKVIFVDHRLQNCYYCSSIISTYF